MGGCGYSYVPTGFADRLRAAGFSDSDVHLLLVDNPRRALTGD
jgi:predicted metal-dependent phosphotriesterase family hydrolase